MPGGAFPLLLVRVVGFGGPGRAAFESAVPVVRDEGFALVALCGAVGVDVVDVGKVGSESSSEQSLDKLGSNGMGDGVERTGLQSR